MIGTAAGLAANAAPAGTGAARDRLVVGPHERWKTLSQALQQARDGDTIELQPGTYRGDVAVVEQRGLHVRGLGTGALLLADGRHAQGKAILVIRHSTVLENLAFRGCRVPDGNGAGVRFEGGHLRVLRCRFHDNEIGLLTSNDANARLDVTDCQFGDAPRAPGPLHHLLYAGTIAALNVQGSRFEQGWRGHLLKSRARSNTLLGNWLVDGPGGEASYELEFPNGGDVLLAGNVIGQSEDTQNATLLAFGAEAGAGDYGRLRVIHNTFVNHAGPGARFHRQWADRLRLLAPTLIDRNLFAGPAARRSREPDLGPDNHFLGLEHLADARRADYRLRADSPLWRALATPWVDQHPLPPLLRHALPVGTRPMPTQALTPGAFQWGD